MMKMGKVGDGLRRALPYMATHTEHAATERGRPALLAADAARRASTPPCARALRARQHGSYVGLYGEFGHGALQRNFTHYAVASSLKFLTPCTVGRTHSTYMYSYVVQRK
jgi:hypothetical protein